MAAIIEIQIFLINDCRCGSMMRHEEIPLTKRPLHWSAGRGNVKAK